MRSTSNLAWIYRLMIVAVLAIIGQAAHAQEAKAATEPTTSAASDSESTMIDSPAFKIGWPKIEMPKFTWKPSFGAGSHSESSAPADGSNAISRTLDKVADTSRRAASTVRNTWGSTLSSLPFVGGNSEVNQVAKNQVAKNDNKGFWSNLFSTSEPDPGPQTVQEFLAQDRVGTTTR